MYPTFFNLNPEKENTPQIELEHLKIDQKFLYKNNPPSIKINENIQDEFDPIYHIGINKKRPLGKINPWAWGLEPVRGCNLSCWHCPAQFLPKGEFKFMSKETWVNTWRLISKLSPYSRVEMANTGEPTLHPDILEFIRLARKISPYSQIQITTNGLTLLKNKISYKKLFDAGLNIVYTDMYTSVEKHIQLAKESGYLYSIYYQENIISPWVYHNNPKLQLIALSDVPDDWPAKKIKRGGLGTFLNNINFEHPIAKKLYIIPVDIAPNRRCSQPMKYIQVSVDGTYLMCCQDVFNDAKQIRNVNEGINGFFTFWIGEYMQKTRRILSFKQRNMHPICKKCNIIFSRCDMRFWDEKLFDQYWDGTKLISH